MIRATPTVGRPPGRARGPLAGGLGLVLAIASVALPYVAHLTRPALLPFGAGLVVIGCGLVLVWGQAAGPAPWLTYAAGMSWFLPSLAVSGASWLDTALRCTALVHLALLSHAALAVGSPGVRGTLDRAVVTLGYATALTAVVGGFRIALPVTGLALGTAALTSRRRGLAPTVRRLRAAAGLVLGMGLVLDAVLRVWSTETEQWIVLIHPVEFATAAVLVAAAGTRRRSIDTITIAGDSSRWLASVLEQELGVESLDIAISDGPDKWLTPDGVARDAPAGKGLPVYDQSGMLAGILDADAQSPLDSSVVEMITLAAANARLRHAVAQQVDELAASRRRLLRAAYSERAALSAQLSSRVIARVSAVELDLERMPRLGAVQERALTTRRALQAIGVGIDPLAPDGSLSHALERLSSHGPCPVVIGHCDDPTSREAAVALWYCCAEASANTAKHAAPGAALRVDIRRQNGRVRAVLADDGSGGADPRGRGLAGLVDRVETLGGTLTLTGQRGMGTVLTIDLPDNADLHTSDWGHPLGEVAGDDDVLVAASTYGRDNRLHGGSP